MTFSDQQKAMCYWQRDRHIDQETEQSPEIDLNKYGQLTFDQGAKAIRRRKYNLCNILKELEPSIQLKMGKRFDSKRMYMDAK